MQPACNRRSCLLLNFDPDAASAFQRKRDETLHERTPEDSLQNCLNLAEDRTMQCEADHTGGWSARIFNHIERSEPSPRSASIGRIHSPTLLDRAPIHRRRRARRPCLRPQADGDANTDCLKMRCPSHGDRGFESLYPSKRLLASRHRRLAGRAGLPGVARESCVLSTWRGPAPRQVGRDGSPVGGCASSASTGIDARCGGPDVSDARGGPEHGGRG
jgi:hypothetical protein